MLLFLKKNKTMGQKKPSKVQQNTRPARTPLEQKKGRTPLDVLENFAQSLFAGTKPHFPGVYQQTSFISQTHNEIEHQTHGE